MTGPALIRSQPVTRKTQISSSENPKKDKGKKVGEVVGGATAECTAVCCCLPCTIMELIILSIYKVPTRLCKKALKKTKRRRSNEKNNQGLLGPAKGGSTRTELIPELDQMVRKAEGDDQDDGRSGTIGLDKEMFDRFHGIGFWRNPSQNDT